MVEVRDDWDFYVCRRNGFDASVVVNFGLTPYAPDPTRSWQLNVKIRMLAPAPNGLSAGEERPTLDQIDTALVKAITPACDALFVGRIIRAGTWTFVYYGRKPEELKPAVETAMASFPAYPRTVATKEDTTWTAYQSLLPSLREMLQVSDRRRVEHLRRNGDELRGSRQVTHWIHFANAADRSRFATAMRSEGFDVTESEFPESHRHPKRFTTRMSRSDFVDYNSIHELSRHLFDRSEEFGGDYGGWKSPVVKSSEQAGKLE